jgi:prevent-host-death family protein
MGVTLPISKVKSHLHELVRRVESRAERVVVTRNGKPAAVLVGVEELSQYEGTIDVLSDPAMMKQLRESQRFFSRARRRT